MTLATLKNIIDEAYAKAGHTAAHVQVRIVFKKQDYEIREVTQFSVVPDVFIWIGEKH